MPIGVTVSPSNAKSFANPISQSDQTVVNFGAGYVTVPSTVTQSPVASSSAAQGAIPTGAVGATGGSTTLLIVAAVGVVAAYFVLKHHKIL